MSDLTHYRCATAIAKLNLNLAHAVLRESAALGLPLEDAKKSLGQAHDDYRHNSPIFAAGFEIRGNVLCDMYSSEPGVITFTTQAKRAFEIASLTLESVMQAAMEKFAELEQELGDGAQFVGDFMPHEIAVIDGFGSVIGLFMDGAWKKPTPPFVWNFMAKSAREARNEASIESAQLNFSEAQELRNHANHLEELVDLSKAYRSGRLVRETIQ